MRIRRITVVVAALAALLVVVAACGGDDDASDGDQTTSPTATADADGDGGDSNGSDDGDGGDDGDSVAGGVDPCGLLTTGEVGAALGETVAEGVSTIENPFASCTWEAESGNFIDVTVYSDSRDEVEAYFEISREDFEDIGGIGEAAYWAGSPFQQIEVLQGDYDMALSVGAFEEEVDARSVAIDLAGKAVGRLP